jgi:hypothetical protein
LLFARLFLTLPITFRVPLPEWFIADQPDADAPIRISGETIVAWDGEPKELEIAAMLAAPPVMEFAEVRMIPFVGINEPPAATPVAAALLMLNTVGDRSIVTVKELLYTSSAAVGSAPVFQRVGSLQLPVLVANTIAIITAPWHQ